MFETKFTYQLEEEKRVEKQLHEIINNFLVFFFIGTSVLYPTSSHNSSNFCSRFIQFVRIFCGFIVCLHVFNFHKPSKYAQVFA